MSEKSNKHIPLEFSPSVKIACKTDIAIYAKLS